MSIGGFLGPVLAGLTGYAEQQKQAEQNRIRQQEAQIRQQMFQNYLKTQQDTEATDKAGLEYFRGGGLSLGQGGLAQPQPIGGGGGDLPELGAGGSPPASNYTAGKGRGFDVAGLYDLAVKAGFKPGEEAATHAATMMAESSGNPDAHNKDGEDSIGLNQINRRAWGMDVPTDPLGNTKFAHDVVFQKQGWPAWSAYKSGAYKRFLPEAMAAARRGGPQARGLAYGGADYPAPPGSAADKQSQGDARVNIPHPGLSSAFAKARGSGFKGTIQDFQRQGGSGSTGPAQPDAGAGDEDGGGGGDAGDGATAPMAEIEATPAEKKEAKQLGVKVAQLVDPMARGKMSLEGLIGAIDKAAPNASSHARMQAVEKYYKLFLAPQEQAQRQLDLERLRAADAEERQRRGFEHQDAITGRRERERRAYEERTGRAKEERDNKRDVELFEDAEGNEHYLQKGKDVPKGWRKAGAGGTSASKGREGDIAGEIRRKDEAYLQQHPDATPAQKQEAHFKHRKDAEQELAGATTHTRSGQAKFAQEWAEAHPGHTDQEFSNAMAGYTADQAIARNFAGGSGANQMRSLNTAAGHLSRLREYAEALQTGDIPRVNQLLQAISRETGHSEVTNFELARDITADEVVRLLTSTGGTEADRQGMQSRIKAASSPEQLVGAMDVMDQFVGERFKGLEQSYARGDQKKSEFFREKMLIPEAQRMFVRADRGRGAQPAPGGGQSGAAPSGGKYSVGQIIEHGGKKYRVTGGSPDDPDLEPVQEPAR